MGSYPGYAQGEAAPREAEFMDWLKDTATNASVSPEERRRRLLNWKSAPYAIFSHPREEHLLPMHVVSGCTGFTPGKVIYDDFVMGAMSLACVGFWGEPGGAEAGQVDGGAEKIAHGAAKVDGHGAEKIADDGAAVCAV